MGHVIPNKWKKHLVLVEFGLKTLEDLNNEIHRYNVVNVNSLIDNIHKELLCNPDSGMYIVSSIPSKAAYKLPNFCISNLQDLDDFKKSLPR